MKAIVVKAIVIALLLTALQVIVLNRIHLFGVATPLVLVYALIILPLNTPRWLSLLIGFVLGLVSDIFTNTPGVATMTLTFIAFVQPVLLRLVLPRDAAENFIPSLAGLGLSKFLVFSLTLTFLHCALTFILESFGFANPLHLLFCVIGSTLLTALFIFTFESIRRE
ncbi:MAG: rod shape-determining protein MreD [Prevotella sp.]|nr:rod shape-determining protein MreD [Prevotella sp.]MCD8288538.1 rod shape-determining protein MreD [Prevotella sp.]MCD8305741.1 rod shape-determining protein MreD [Prevotella sp.]